MGFWEKEYRQRSKLLALAVKTRLTPQIPTSRSGGMVDTLDSKSGELHARVGSSPTCGTNFKGVMV